MQAPPLLELDTSPLLPPLLVRPLEPPLEPPLLLLLLLLPTPPLVETPELPPLLASPEDPPVDPPPLLLDEEEDSSVPVPLGEQPPTTSPAITHPTNTTRRMIPPTRGGLLHPWAPLGWRDEFSFQNSYLRVVVECPGDLVAPARAAWQPPGTSTAQANLGTLLRNIKQSASR